MSILRLDKDSFAFGSKDDDKDTYAEFFENEAKSSTRSRVQNFYRPETTSGPLTEFINPKSRTARSDQKYEALYRRLLDVCLLFFQEVRVMSMQISNLQNKTTESVYHVCLKDILNWKKDTIDFWKVRCIARHKDFEYTFRLAFKKFMTDFYDDDDVFDVNINTGIVIPSGSSNEKKKSTPTIFYNIPDVGDFFYNVICFMTQLPDVKSTKILNNQTSLESCVYHSMNESMLQMSKDVIRTMESREVIHKGFMDNNYLTETTGNTSNKKKKQFYDISDSVSVSSKKSKRSQTLALQSPAALQLPATLHTQSALQSSLYTPAMQPEPVYYPGYGVMIPRQEVPIGQLQGPQEAWRPQEAAQYQQYQQTLGDTGSVLRLKM